MDKRRGAIGLVVAICLIAVLVYDQYRNGPAPVESAGTATSGPAQELPLADDGSGADDTAAAGAPSPATEPKADSNVAPSAETAAPAAEAPAAEPPVAAKPDAGNASTGEATSQPPASATAPAEAPPADAEAPPAKTAAAEPSAGDAPAAEAPPAPSVGATQSAPEPAVNPPAPAAPSGTLPSFDVVRVEPTGETVIAGQAPPNAEVEILDGNAPLARAEANERGEWAMALDRPLPPGSHDLAIRTTTEDRKTVTLSDQRVAVSVPGGGSKDVLVVINTPDAASRVVEAGSGEGTSAPASATPPAATAASSAPSAASTAAEPAPAAVATAETPPAESAAAPSSSSSGETAAPATAAVEAPTAEAPAPAPEAAQPETAAVAEPAAGPASGASGTGSSTASSEATPEATAPAAATSEAASSQAPSVPAPVVAVTAVEADTNGALFIAGTASTADSVRVYLDDVFVGAAEPTEGGTWLLQAERDLPAGQYKVRADQVDKSGNVVVRAEVPFEREVAVALLKPEGSAAGTSGTAASGALPDPQTVIIKRGDNLWRLSRSMYGRGMRWSTIYTANKDQIRNPRWIYPGQVFVVPAGDTTWKN